MIYISEVVYDSSRAAKVSMGQASWRAAGPSAELLRDTMGGKVAAEKEVEEGRRGGANIEEMAVWGVGSAT